MARDSMTLDEAIRFIKQALENVNPDKRVHYEFRFTVEQVKRLLVWLEDYKRLQSASDSRNSELRRLLRMAVDDLDKSIKACETDMLCEICSYEAECNCFNYCFIYKNLRSWKHHDEAMELLGGAENANG